VGFNGLFPKGESIMCTIYGYLYSARESITSPFPEFSSEVAEEGFKTLLQLKKELSSDEIFASDEEYNLILLYTQKILFSHFWDFEHNIQDYVMSPFPGRKKGISGSCIGGYLLGINKYISDEKIKAAAVVLEYFTSAEFQKEFVIKYYQSYSGMNKLYDDEEVCSYVDCKLIKSIQGIERPSAVIDNYESYSNKITNIISEFLYNGKPVTDTLREIDDFTKINYYSIKDSFLSF